MKNSVKEKATPAVIIQKILQERGETPYRLNQVIGGGNDTLGKIMLTGGENMRLSTLRLICEALQIDPGDFIRRLDPIILPEVTTPKKRGRPKLEKK